MKIPPALASFFNSRSPRGDSTMSYLAELIAINGGQAEVTNFGVVTPDEESPFGRKGLTVNEAFHLNQLVNFLKGILWALGSPGIEQDVLMHIQAEVERKKSGRTVMLASGSDIDHYGKAWK